MEILEKDLRQKGILIAYGNAVVGINKDYAAPGIKYDFTKKEGVK